nr:SGNH/GDSL hydrolase family protein [Klebsiella pneumoniae]
MNSGIIGTNTAEWLPGGTLLVSAALPTNVTHILIQLGTNDRGMATGSSYMAGAQGTFVNLNAIVNSLRSSYPGVRIILIAPPYAPTDSAYGSSDEIARAVRRAARVLECGFIDQYSATLEVEMQGESWLSDGLHPNDYGYRTMFKNLQAAIVSAGSR